MSATTNQLRYITHVMIYSIHIELCLLRHNSSCIGVVIVAMSLLHLIWPTVTSACISFGCKLLKERNQRPHTKLFAYESYIAPV